MKDMIFKYYHFVVILSMMLMPMEILLKGKMYLYHIPDAEIRQKADENNYLCVDDFNHISKLK